MPQVLRSASKKHIPLTSIGIVVTKKNMGYTTKFEGEFKILPPLSAEVNAYLTRFSMIRHMKRDPAKLADKPDPCRKAVGLGLGVEGEFYVGSLDPYGQDHDPDIIDWNTEPSTQPGLWCQWEPRHNGQLLAWNGTEKFYNYVEWLQYLISSFFAKWGHALNGTVSYQGEDPDDFGEIRVISNKISVRKGVKTLGEWEAV